ncbi:MAG: flavin reductase family protein [Actinomycetota bacterium]|nr:flavin reductase family protein [Actinomycetota bacterium]
MTAPEPDVFRAAMSHFASGVTVVTTVQGGIDHAMTASAFTSVSLDPPLVLVCVDKSARFHQAVALSRSWGASILTGSQQPLARRLATRGRPLAGQLADYAHSRGPHTGAALLDRALCRLECRTWEMYDGGDHTIVVGEVVWLDAPDTDEPAMVWFRSTFVSI